MGLLEDYITLKNKEEEFSSMALFLKKQSLLELKEIFLIMSSLTVGSIILTILMMIMIDLKTEVFIITSTILVASTSLMGLYYKLEERFKKEIKDDVLTHKIAIIEDKVKKMSDLEIISLLEDANQLSMLNYKHFHFLHENIIKKKYNKFSELDYHLVQINKNEHLQVILND